MPAKKAAPRKATSPDMSTIWAWVYAAGLVVAGIAGAIGLLPTIGTVAAAAPDAAAVAGTPTGSWGWLAYLLLVVAIVIGLFYFDSEDIGQFGLRVLILLGVYSVLAAEPRFGSYVTGFFGGWLFFLMPVVLAMALMFFWRKRIAPLF